MLFASLAASFSSTASKFRSTPRIFFTKLRRASSTCLLPTAASTMSRCATNSDKRWSEEHTSHSPSRRPESQPPRPISTRPSETLHLSSRSLCIPTPSPPDHSLEPSAVCYLLESESLHYLLFSAATFDSSKFILLQIGHHRIDIFGLSPAPAATNLVLSPEEPSRTSGSAQ
ncbi:unnamed protein product [Microthlaspi erraticum]|uniref:Uncharacterized protein n=1 Tax=Microthlaspi erraticum TaxID=1685480 RepID=A0A6D2KY23_9BRAS|nr:unnamed protein product [Microthlaspi erraticum]